MSERAHTRMTEIEFFDWLQHQERRHELVDGVPVMMAGANAAHDTVVINMTGLLFAELRGKPCRPFSADTAIRIPRGNIRYPDLSVDCGKRDPSSMTATQPTLVVEVLSPSTRVFDQDDKLEEYKLVDSVAHVLFINPLEPDARLHTRTASGAWAISRVSGLQARIELPAIGATLAMSDIYDGVAFTPRPRILLVSEPASDVEPE